MAVFPLTQSPIKPENLLVRANDGREIVFQVSYNLRILNFRLVPLLLFKINKLQQTHNSLKALSLVLKLDCILHVYLTNYIVHVFTLCELKNKYIIRNLQQEKQSLISKFFNLCCFYL